MQRPLTPELTFDGFTWPRYVATLASIRAAIRHTAAAYRRAKRAMET